MAAQLSTICQLAPAAPCTPPLLLCSSASDVDVRLFNVLHSIPKGLFTNDVGIFWGLWHPLVLMSAYHQLLACPLVLQIDYVSPEPKTIIFRIQFISTRVIRICVTKGVQLSLVRPTKACFGWIPSNCWIFHHSSSFLMTLGPSSSAFVSFLSYRWLFNDATSFVNGPIVGFLNIDSNTVNHSLWWMHEMCRGGSIYATKALS